MAGLKGLNKDQGFSCIENYEVTASAKFSAASQAVGAGITEQHPLELLVHIWKNTDILIQVYLGFMYTEYFFSFIFH